ncbi:heat shock 70 kDa protein 8 [Selaginella moellendorffii]|nr:heat shock 70 kDa protein 8 [Selaginella moellendorffii]|eukprot:XP_002980626.2 heat shock 70 kDa protein 8 [Selaginella moellendorffii]
MAAESSPSYIVTGEPMIDEPPDGSTALPAPLESSAAIGIDLGTSSSAVAVWRNGRVEVFQCPEDRKSLPAYVLFSDTPTGINKVGGGASEDELWSGRAIFGAKKLVGRTDTDPIVQSCREKYPFLIESLGIGLKPFLGARGSNNIWRSTTPEEILALQLMELRAIAEFHLGRIVRSAVVTVPVCFSRFQLMTIERACVMAGLQVARLMPEPTAAGLVYAQMIQQQGISAPVSASAAEKLALIFNMGAGYCDVAITATAGGVSQIRGLAGEAFGGEELLQNLVSYLVSEMIPQLGHSPAKAALAIATGRLRFAAERAMHALSIEPDALVEMELGNGQIFSRSVTREVFEDLNAGVFARCSSLVVGCLRDADVEPVAISDVIAVGGASSVPGVKEALEKIFGARKMEALLHNQIQSSGIDTSEAAARGAALEGAIMSGVTDPNGSLDLLTIQAMASSVGVALLGGEFQPILHKNSMIPARRDVVVTTSRDNQRDALIVVYEGESKNARSNHLLGFFKLAGLPAAPKGVPLITVCVDVDASNVLRVMAGACLPKDCGGDGSGGVAALELREVRMPTVDDGHDWCVEALWNKHGDSMDVVLLQQPVPMS